jgi:probable F420-dependent oxidoreductase
MKLAYFGINFGPCADPDVAARVAQAAEAAGLESLWTGEHVVLPDPQVPPSPSPPENPFLDPAVALAWVAAATTRILLGTGIIILPQRNPVVLAKELASVDVVSKGRLIFGIGAGYLKPEFDAIGAPFDHKSARTIDFLEAMLALWTQEKPAYDGRFVRFGGVQAFPRPVQKPHPPIVMGGHAPEAFRRSVLHAQGWYGFALDPAATAACLEGLRAAEKQYGRPAHLGPLEISITPAAGISAETVQQYADLGVHRLIFYRPTAGLDDTLAVVENIGALGR